MVNHRSAQRTKERDYLLQRRGVGRDCLKQRICFRKLEVGSGERVK